MPPNASHGVSVGSSSFASAVLASASRDRRGATAAVVVDQAGEPFGSRVAAEVPGRVGGDDRTAERVATEHDLAAEALWLFRSRPSGLRPCGPCPSSWRTPRASWGRVRSGCGTWRPVRTGRFAFCFSELLAVFLTDRLAVFLGPFEEFRRSDFAFSQFFFNLRNCFFFDDGAVFFFNFFLDQACVYVFRQDFRRGLLQVLSEIAEVVVEELFRRVFVFFRVFGFPALPAVRRTCTWSAPSGSRGSSRDVRPPTPASREWLRRATWRTARSTRRRPRSPAPARARSSRFRPSGQTLMIPILFRLIFPSWGAVIVSAFFSACLSRCDLHDHRSRP